MKFITDNLVKILGSITTSISTLLAANAFEGLLSANGIRIMNIVNVIVGAALVAVGFNNSAKIEVARAMQTALMTPPPKQGGFARLGILGVLAALAAAVMLSACTTTPDGDRRLSPEGQAILETSTRIAVRHYVADSPRAAERVQNLREVVGKLQQLTSAETTLGALKSVVVREIERLNLAPIDKTDALDLLDLFAAALEARLGQEPLQAAGLVKVNEFLSLVLAAIPTEATAGTGTIER